MVRRVILLTDGATRAVRPFNLHDWRGVFSVMASQGPAELIRQVRTAEVADAAACQHPRNKIHDDASAVLVNL
jgi:hypothetical protein